MEVHNDLFSVVVRRDGRFVAYIRKIDIAGLSLDKVSELFKQGVENATRYTRVCKPNKHARY